MYNSKNRLGPSRQYTKDVQEQIRRNLLKDYNNDLKRIYEVKKKKEKK